MPLTPRRGAVDKSIVSYLRQKFGLFDAEIQNRTTLRHRLILTVGLAMGGGVTLGLLVSSYESGAAVAMLVGPSLGTLICIWACRLVTTPVERLAAQIQAMAGREQELETIIANLPTERKDRVGELARSVRRLALQGMRHEVEQRQLRQTLDHRVQKETRKATAQLRKLAMRDPLTGLGNRRYLDSQVKRVAQRCLGTDSGLACLALDLDHFKTVNDTLGHATGDELLVSLANTISQQIRDTDFAARLGGDEFVVILVGADLEAGKVKARAIRHAFQAATAALAAACPLGVDVSIGVSCCRASGCLSFAELLEAADCDLYRVKDEHHAAASEPRHAAA